MKRFLKDEAGQGMVEYILIVALVAIIAIAGIRLFGRHINELFTGAAQKVKSEGQSAGIMN